jgi:chemotaxis protein MotB
MSSLLRAAATLTLAALLVVVGACAPKVLKTTHDAALAKLARCQKQLKTTQKELDGSQGELAAITGQAKSLRKNVATLGDQKSALAKRLGATKKELAELRKQRAKAEARSKVFRSLVKRLKAMIDSGKLKVKIRKGRMIVQLSDKILFDPGRTSLKKEGKKAIEELSLVLKDIGKRDFLVAGHTDNQPIRTKRFRSNWELSAARAVEVVKFLQQQGVDPKHLAAAGFSEYDPVGDNANDEGRTVNRRIEIVLLPNVAELPKIDL